MSKKFKITIEVEGGTTTSKITDDAGNSKILDGLSIHGYSKTSNDLYIFAWGSPADAAYAIGEGLSKAIARDDRFYIDFYKCLLAQMCLRTGVNPNENVNKIDSKELLDKWDKEDANKDTDNKKTTH